MAKCDECNQEIGFLRYILNSGVCDKCYDQRKAIKQKEIEEREKENKAIQLLENRGVKFLQETNTISIKVMNTPLMGKVPKKYLSFGMFMEVPNEGTLIESNTKVDSLKEYLTDKLMESDYDIDAVLEWFYERLLVSLEVKKIKEREAKLNLREKAEKEYFGEVRTKRKPLTEAEKESILDKFNRQCTICGATEGLHIHHKDQNPKNNAVDNLVVLCGVCHKKIHMKVR